MWARGKDGVDIQIRRVTDYGWYDKMTPEQIAQEQARLDKERASIVNQIKAFERDGVEPDQELVDYLEWFDANN
jgi:phage terminase large subunit-like protein